VQNQGVFINTHRITFAHYINKNARFANAISRTFNKVTKSEQVSQFSNRLLNKIPQVTAVESSTDADRMDRRITPKKEAL
jgi:hypothetical protein